MMHVDALSVFSDRWRLKHLKTYNNTLRFKTNRGKIVLKLCRDGACFSALCIMKWGMYSAVFISGKAIGDAEFAKKTGKG